MATIPVLNESSVSTNILPTPQRSMNSPVGHALEGLGRAVNGVGSQMFEEGMEQKFKADAAVVQGALAQHTDKRVNLFSGPLVADPATGKASSGFLNTQGEQAIGIEAPALAAYDKMTGEIEHTLKNDSQRRLFNQHVAAERGQLHLDINRHEFTQGKVVQEKNATALTNSLEQLASTQFMDMGAGGSFDKTVEKIRINEYGKMIAKGFSHESPATTEAVAVATSKAYGNAIEQLSLVNPIAANDRLKEVRDRLLPNEALRVEKELAPKLEAYKDEKMVDQLKPYFPKSVDEPWDRPKLNDMVDAITEDPITRKRVKAELKQREGDWADSISKQYASLKGSINMKYGRDSWEQGKEAPIGPVKQSNEFGKLTKTEQDAVLEKFGAENWKIREHREKMESERRTRQSAARSAETATRVAAKAAEAEKHKGVIEEQNKESAYWLTHSQELSELSPDQVNALNVSHADLKSIASQHKTLTSPKALHKAKADDVTIRSLIEATGVKDSATISHLASSTKTFLAQEQERKGAMLTSDETEVAVIKAMQMVYKEETITHTFGKDEKKLVAHRRAELQAKDVIYPDKVKKVVDAKIAKLRGRKISDKLRQSLYEDELANQALPARAEGGPVVPGEDYLMGEKGPEVIEHDDGTKKVVGENGPEVVTAHKAGTVIPNDQVDKKGWAKRADGSTKGNGWLGVMQRPDGKVSSEISVGVEIGGKEMDIPSMVPGLSKYEINYLLTNPTDGNMFKSATGKRIIQKAAAHAKKRISEGKSPFAGDQEDN